MHARDLFVVFLRMAGLLLIGGILTYAVGFMGLQTPVGTFGLAGLVTGAGLLVAGVWALLGAPPLVARLRWPEASAAAQAEPTPSPATWIAVGERCVAWFFVLDATPLAAEVIATIIQVGGPADRVRGWLAWSELWGLLLSLTMAAILFRHSRRRLGVEA